MNGVSESFQALMDRANRGREFNIQEVETLLNMLHLINDDLPAISDILDALFAGVEDPEEEVDRLVEKLKKRLSALELELAEPYVGSVDYFTDGRFDD
jgi:hypothetical protein